MTVLHLEVVDNALLEMLRSQTDPSGDLFRIGDAEAPPAAPGAVGPQMPYAVVFPREGSALIGESMKNPHNHLEVTYQVLCVGYKRQAARHMSDWIREAILGRDAASTEYLNPIVPTGIGVGWRRQVATGSVTREGTIWNVSDEYALGLVPPPF